MYCYKLTINLKEDRNNVKMEGIDFFVPNKGGFLRDRGIYFAE